MEEHRARRLAAGDTLQHYEVIRPLGEGGMGEVLLARDTRLGRRVALKLLTKHAGERAERFLIEARATAQLGHENIVVIHELGEHEQTPYMVLEYLQGKTFEQLLRARRGPELPETEDEEARDAPPQPAAAVGLPPGRAVELMIPVARALAFAHKRGIIHRDLKPSNIFLTDTGIVKVLDFGIAKQVGVEEVAVDVSASTLSDAGVLLETKALTATGARMGTLPYMSPEQWRGETVDPRSDVWAAGLVLAELVLGRHPLAPLSLFSLATIQRLDLPMPSLSELRPDLGKLGSIIDRCLLKRAEDRLGSARELCAELEALLPGRAAVVDEERNPFAGLAAFQPADAARFFGRTAAVAQVVARLAEQPLLVIVGPSGAGKSSFVRAGVIPALERAEAWEALTLRPGSRPLAALADLLLLDALQTSSQGGLVKGAHASLSGEDREGLTARLRAEPGLLGTRLRELSRRRLKRVLLFVDQLEELYTLAPETERRAFLACLAGAADDAGSPVRAVLAIRSDFLDRLAGASATLSTLHQGLLLLPPMDRDGLREALVRPLEAVEHRFEPPALVEQMLDELSHVNAALPLLSFTAARLWEQRDRGQRALTEASYRRMGGLAGALSGHADAVLGAMSTEERKLARAALVRLVTPERTRAVVAMRELAELGPRTGEMERVLGRLIDARLLSVEGRGEAEATVELVHESLIAGWPMLAAWLSENQEDAALLSRLGDAARAWAAAGRSEDLLFRGDVLESARLWRARYTGELARGEERFLEASIRLSDRARRLRRQVTLGVIGALSLVVVLVSFLAVRAQEEARQARNATRMAAARERAADPTTVLAILREVEPPEVPRGWAELSRWALGAGVARVVLVHPHVVASAAFSPDGTRIVTASYDKTARVWSADGSSQPLVLRGHEHWVISAGFSADGKRIFTASQDKTVRVWNADGTGEPLVLRGAAAAYNVAAWSPNGKSIAAPSDDHTSTASALPECPLSPGPFPPISGERGEATGFPAAISLPPRSGEGPGMGARQQGRAGG